MSLNAGLDSIGILQLTWLLGNEPHLANVELPDLQALRRAGMFPIQMSERVEERMYRNAKETSIILGEADAVEAEYPSVSTNGVSSDL